MEGGQRIPIDLEAGLNINTSDMLTPLASQTFQHNWQKFQGKFIPNSLRFEKNGWAAGWNVHNFIYNDDGSVDVTSVDIRDPDNTKVIGKLKAGEYQLLKQQWNSTVEVENFWWIDSKHILELNSTHFVLKRKDGTLHDWNGDNFINVYKYSHIGILNSKTLHYFVPSVYRYERPAPFITVEVGSKYGLLVKVYRPRDKMQFDSEYHFNIREHSLGQILNDLTYSGNTAYFNSYTLLTAGQVLGKAEWSSTLVGNWLIIGCHFGTNYDQWSVVINLSDKIVHKVIQGYGYVGLHGELTGGQIPNGWFDVDKGFNSTVQPLTVLNRPPSDPSNADADYKVSNVSEINQITRKCVGTPEQQWYIEKECIGIVSHLKFDNGNFTKEVLPITNNFDACYKSPSFTNWAFADLLPNLWNAGTLLGGFAGPVGSVLGTALGLVGGANTIAYIAPRFGELVYLQQTFGQYAFVHYNSSRSLPEPDREKENDVETSLSKAGLKERPAVKDVDPVLSDYLNFDKQVFEQADRVNPTIANLGFLGLLLFGFVDGEIANRIKPSVNEEQLQTTTNDTGKVMTTFAKANVDQILTTVLGANGHFDISCTSRIVGIRSLDMFYSTSDTQRVWAGPGFVEHQYVADCVAQSSTDTQTEGKVLQAFMVLKFFTVILAKIQLRINTLLKKAAVKALDGLISALKIQSNETIYGGESGPAAEIAIGLASGLESMKKALEDDLANAEAEEEKIKEVEKLVNEFNPNGPTSHVVNTLSRHALSVEAKHKYGEKFETFMWPCWGANSVNFTDEKVVADIKDMQWELSMPISKGFAQYGVKYEPDEAVPYSSVSLPGSFIVDNAFTNFKGLIPFYQATCHTNKAVKALPQDMASVIGVNTLMPSEPFKNENIGASEPAFGPSAQQDYIIDKDWNLSQYCTYGQQQWVAVKDTKIINCPPSNVYVTDDFCGVACAYTAVEVKKHVSKQYMRPWAVTPNTLAFNCTGLNCILDDKLYHGFDGISTRIVNFVGEPGMNKSMQTFLYSFQKNDRFKRSNIIPANEFMGNFYADPEQAAETIDELVTLVTCAPRLKGLEGGVVGEDKDLIRWSIPIFTEHVSTLPAAVKTLTAMPLGVVQGVTSLCVSLENNQTEYKAPLSVDFTIGKQVYRVTEEYICTVETKDGIDIISDIIPLLGLKYIGSTPTEAYFYSKSTRCYYIFTGSSLTKMDIMERFRDIQKGYWDFVNQEVVLPCLMTFKRLNAEVEDKDTETDNIIVPVLSKNQVSGELPPPITTIFNDRSWYKCVSLPCGFAYQGPNRVIINRTVFCEYMERSIKDNYSKWKKINKEKYATHREYPEVYDNIMKDVQGVDGWTYNPFILVTSALGQSEDTDCIFEWNITFCWPIEMDLLYGTDNYAVVNIAAETMTPGGKVTTRPTHVYLTKELFTRNGKYGYYSFRYQSKNGIGNRERLHIWSDQYIAISSIDCECKSITQRRNEQLTQQVDIAKLKEL